jgi:hypothetical protein
MASLALSVVSVVIGYLVLRYRVHVVVVVQPRPPKAGARALSRSNPTKNRQDLRTRRTGHLIIELTTTPVVLVNGCAPAFAPFIWRTYAVMFTVVSSFMFLNWKLGSLTVI